MRPFRPVARVPGQKQSVEPHDPVHAFVVHPWLAQIHETPVQESAHPPTAKGQPPIAISRIKDSRIVSQITVALPLLFVLMAKTN